MVRLMLYKKIHRQYVRQFKEGREYKKCIDSNYYKVCKVIYKPYIDDIFIRVDGWRLVHLPSGQLCNRNVFKWLD